MVEHNLAKVGVAGSNPVSRSINYRVQAIKEAQTGLTQMAKPISLSSKISRLDSYLEEKGLKRTLQREIIAKDLSRFRHPYRA